MKLSKNLTKLVNVTKGNTDSYSHMTKIFTRQVLRMVTD